jgi:hypothetical protein
MELPKIPELFPNGHKMQNLIYQLALGYIVSLMFYYILVFPDEVRSRRANKLYLYNELRVHFAEIAIYIASMEANKVGHYTPLHTSFPTKKRITELCSAWRPDQNGFQITAETNRRITMWERLRQMSFAWDAMQERIPIKMRSVDSEMWINVLAIDQCHFLTFLKTSRGMSDPGTNLMEAFADFFWEYLELNRKLGRYCHLKYETLPFEKFFELSAP